MELKAKPGNTDLRQERRYVRLEIFSPVDFSVLTIDKEKRVRRHPEKRAGILLNLSGGGALIATNDQAACDDMVIMSFRIKGFENLTDVLGLVKRVEECEDGERLMGVQFVTPEQVNDPELSKSLARLTTNPMGFSDSLKRLVSRYVFQRQIDSEGQEK